MSDEKEDSGIVDDGLLKKPKKKGANIPEELQRTLAGRLMGAKVQQKFKDQESKIKPGYTQAAEEKIDLRLKLHDKQLTKFELQELKLIEWLTRNFYSKKEICRELNEMRRKNGEPEMCQDTFNRYEKKFPQYFAKADDWRKDAADQVELALVKSALGFETREEKALVVSDGAEAGSHVEIHSVKKQHAPNYNSMAFFLTNLRSDIYKLKSEMKVEDFSKMSDAELAELVRNQLKKDFPEN